MKKLTKLLCILVMLSILVALVVTLASCNSPMSVTNEEEFVDTLKQIWLKKTKSTIISIDDDISIFANEGYFGNYGNTYKDTAKLSGITIKGNGHTITVKGDNGLVGPVCWGFFATLDNCTVSDLNIVYDMMPAAGRCGGFGGLAQNIAASTINNVNITFKKGLDYEGAGTNEVGGLAAYVQNGSTITNCSVKGNVTTTGACGGGLVGSLYSGSSLVNCTYEGKVTTLVYTEYYRDSEYRGYVGGLVGMCYGNLTNCHLISDGIAAELSTESWRAVEMDVGLFCGYLSGNLINCYADLKENAAVSVKRNDYGVFSRSVHSGMFCGHVSNSAKVKNVYIDATKWKLGDSTFGTSNITTNVGFASNSSTNFENVYFVNGGNFIFKNSFTVPYQVIVDETGSFTYSHNDKNHTVDNGRRIRLSIPCEFMGRENKFVLEFIIDNSTGEWIYSEAAMLDVLGNGWYPHAWAETITPAVRNTST